MNITDDILVSYILKELPAEQHSAVQAWIAASRENKERFDELRLIWKESGKLGVQSTVDVEEAWGRFRNTVSSGMPKRQPLPVLRMARMAAAVLLVAAGAYVGWMAMRDHKDDSAHLVVSAVPAAPLAETTTVAPEVAQPADEHASSPMQEPVHTGTAGIAVKEPAKTGTPVADTHHTSPADNHRTKEFVCNATPCPLEICIVQTVRCGNGTSKKIATCNVLQPDQAGQLHYKAFDRTTGNCDATVAEIRIKRVSTGETIVLNKETQPSTVEEIFDYLTGVKKAQVDILAGVFETDCDNSCNQHKLKIGSDMSHLILQ